MNFKRTPLVWGTSHFISYTAARNYYSEQFPHSKEGTRTSVDEKIHSGAISIGPPKLKPGEKLLINNEEGRFFISSE
jgi:hypothetical protein